MLENRNSHNRRGDSRTHAEGTGESCPGLLPRSCRRTSSLLRSCIWLLSLVLFSSCLSWLPRMQEEEDSYSFPWDSPMPEDTGKDPSADSRPDAEEIREMADNPIEPDKDSKLQLEKKQKTQRGREIVTRFYGAELIRQRIYINGKPEWRIQLRGNATIEHGNVLIRAPAITIDAGKYGRMSGGVRIYDSESGIFIRASRGVYNGEKEIVQLLGWPYMRIKKQGQETTHVTCVRMERDLAAEVAYLKEDVRIHHSDYNILADQASYTDEKEVIEIPGKPRILGKGEYLTGDRILYYTGEEKAILEGRTIYATYEPEKVETSNLETYARTHGPISDRAIREAEKRAPRQNPAEKPREDYRNNSGRDSSKDAQDATDVPDIASFQDGDPTSSKKPSGPVLQVLSADRIEHNFSDKKNPITRIEGNVVFTDPDRELRSPLLIGTGPSMATLSTDQGVELIDRKENIRVKSREMEYKRVEQFLTLTGDPLVEFLDEETGEVTGTLTGAFIERDFQAEVTLARGNVELNRGQDRARGEIARYEEKNGYLEFLGNPRVFRDGSWIQCSLVRMYPDEDRIVFEKNITGAIVE